MSLLVTAKQNYSIMEIFSFVNHSYTFIVDPVKERWARREATDFWFAQHKAHIRARTAHRSKKLIKALC